MNEKQLNMKNLHYLITVFLCENWEMAKLWVGTVLNFYFKLIVIFYQFFVIRERKTQTKNSVHCIKGGLPN